ncbi:hypothetical protein Tco_0881336, partial [Tanacetum coccineum]
MSSIRLNIVIINKLFQPDSSPAQTSEVPIEHQPDPSLKPSPTTTIPDSIPETSGENLGGHSSSDKSLSGNEGDMTIQGVYNLCLSLCKQVSDQAKEIQDLKAQITKLKKQAKPVIKHHKAYLKSVSLKQRFPRKSFSKKHRTGIIPVNTARTSGTKNFSTARQSVNRQTVLTSTAMKVNTVKHIVNGVRPGNVFNKTHSSSTRPFKKTTVLRQKNSNQKFNTAKVNAVSTVGEKRETAVKPSAGCNWRPQRYHDGSKYNSGSNL